MLIIRVPLRLENTYRHPLRLVDAIRSSVALRARTGDQLEIDGDKQKVRSRRELSRESREKMAEGQGFEPWEGVNLRRFSRPVHSTTLPPLRGSGRLYLALIRKQAITNKVLQIRLLSDHIG